MTAAGRRFGQRESDFAAGVPDLMAPVTGVDGVIATPITPFIAQRPQVCDRATALERVREAARAISADMNAAVQP